jgi:hypothetical protein
MVFGSPNPALTSGILQGIEVMIGRRNSVNAPAPQPITDKTIRLSVGSGRIKSNNKATTSQYAAMTSGFEFVVYGGQADTWGLPPIIALADIDTYIALEFECQVPVCCSASKIHFDCAQVRVYWTSVPPTANLTPILTPNATPSPTPTSNPTPSPTPTAISTPTAPATPNSTPSPPMSPIPPNSSSGSTPQPTPNPTLTPQPESVSTLPVQTPQPSSRPTPLPVSASSISTAPDSGHHGSCSAFNAQCAQCIGSVSLCRFCDGACVESSVLCPPGATVNIDASGLCPTGASHTAVGSPPLTEAASESTSNAAIGGTIIGESLGMWPWVGLGIGLFVLLLIIAVIVVIVVRRRNKAHSRARARSNDLETLGLSDLSSAASAFETVMDSGGTITTPPRTSEYASVTFRNAETIDAAPRGSSALAPVQYGAADFLTDERPDSANDG